VFRSLRVLGLVCEHKVDDDESSTISNIISNTEGVSGKSLTWENIVSSCYHLFLRYLGKQDAETKSKALLALSGIFVNYPRLLLDLEEDGLIETLMSSTSPPLLQMESPICWRKILVVRLITCD
jgi:hypothetical protein